MARSRSFRKLIAPGLAAAGLTVFGQALAQAPDTFGVLHLNAQATRLPAPAAVPAESHLALAVDDADRLTVPVTINGKGPFPFVIDTGANQTVISRELADQLGLPAGPPVMVHTTSGAYLEPTARLDEIQVGKRSIKRVTAPVFGHVALGAAGMLGIDGLDKQTMLLDIKARRIKVSPSSFWTTDPDAIVVRGKSLYGGLVLVDAHVGSIPIYVILDTGAQGTVGNEALHRQLALKDPDGAVFAQTVVISVSGQSTAAQIRNLPKVNLGGIEFHNLPVAFADLHTFAKFHLTDRPAMLLGMDVLQTFERVSVDFGRKTVRFRLNDQG